MEDDAFSRIIKLISIKTGLRLDGHDGGTLRKVAADRMALHGFSVEAQYGGLLESGTAEGRREREELISLLTVGESFFFRDKGQFNLLREVILPELIEQRKAERTLNIWSAGCATGEEPYSIAIILHEALPDIDDWHLSIIGSDIKDEFLEKAKKAVYRDWSFRMVPEEIRRKYFKEERGLSMLDPVIRNMVTFRRGNLLDEQFPVPVGMGGDVDLVVCRNVFIYYRRAAAAAIVRKMAEVLRIGGYLITGHWELFSSPTGLLVPRMFSSSLAYQRVSVEASTKPELSVSSAPAAKLVTSTTDTAASQSSFSDTPALREKKEPPSSAHRPVEEASEGAHKEADTSSSGDFDALCRAARAYADKGQHEPAVECLIKAIALNPIAAEPYYILSHIAEENGDTVAAQEYLKKVIYLEPSSVNGHLDLAAMYEADEDQEKARKMRVAALGALRQLPPQSIVEPYGKTAAEFASLMEKLLE